MELKDLSLVVKNVLSEEECDALIEEYERKKFSSFEENNMNPYGEMETATFRTIELTEKSKNFETVRKGFETGLQQWADYLGSLDSFHMLLLKNNLAFVHQFRLLKYGLGAKINQHSDYAPGFVATVSLNLNENYTGGELVFFNGKYTVSLEKGDAFVFPCDYYWLHETNPITNGCRYVVNGFVTSRPIKEINEFRRNTTHNPRLFNIK